MDSQRIMTQGSTLEPTPRLGRAEGYRPIRDYAAIGDCHGSALVARDGRIDWCALGRFDADPVFCRLLDDRRGGFLSLTPSGPFTVTRAYLPATNVLRTEFRGPTGCVEIIDFMPVGRKAEAGVHDYVQLNAPGCLIRRIEGLAGSVEVHFEFRPSVAFASRPARLEQDSDGISVAGGGPLLRTNLPRKIREEIADGGATIRAGDRRFIAVCAGPLRLDNERVDALYQTTCAFWREWIDYCRYTGPYGESVRRSALALKAMTYAPTGALVAALTTSLPEALGGERNWDYRYCWVRDACLVLQALSWLGYSGEAKQFYAFMREALHGAAENLQVMYGVTMERDLVERHLDHLDGYLGSRPVRTGNAAYRQRQTDLYGYVLEAALAYDALGGRISADDKQAFARIADFIWDCWSQPDMGLWEVRSSPRHFVHSKAMCWIVVDRAIRLVGKRPEWLALRHRILRAIMGRGLSAEGFFLQSFSPPDRPHVDAALLQLCMMGLPVDDETLRRTREAVERALRKGDFVHRYTSEDGVAGSEGCFLVCSFWLVDALLFEGRAAEAQALFERLLTHRNDVGLYSEEIDLASGAFLGNFPQAFTHLGLIGSAVNLELFRKGGTAALRGSYADRARRSVGATIGWRGVLAAFVRARRLKVFSSGKSRLKLE